MSDNVKVTYDSEGRPTIVLIGPTSYRGEKIPQTVINYVGGPHPYIWVGSDDRFYGTVNPGALTALIRAGRRKARRKPAVAHARVIPKKARTSTNARSTRSARANA